MKSSNLNNLGKKYLVEDCQKIRIDSIVKKTRGEVLNSLITGMVEIGGFIVGVIGKKLHHGGDRLWFTCPICNLPCGIIYRHPIENNLIGCRKCLNLEYRCRRFKGMVENDM